MYFLFLLAVAVTSDSTSSVENCSAFSTDREELVALPTLRVSGLIDSEEFSLPQGAPAKISFISCERDQLLPLPSDYKVLAAGLPLVIASGDRVAVLEVADGRVHFRTLEGEFTDEEIPLIQDYMNRVQPLLNAANDQA